MATLVGEYERSIDGNGRLTLPSSFASQFEGEAYLTDDHDGCARITKAAEFEARIKALTAKFEAGEITANEVRAHTQASRLVKIDKQGRLTLDEGARRDAGLQLGGEAILIGFDSSVEIWRPSRCRKIMQETAHAKPRRVWDDEDEE